MLPIYNIRVYQHDYLIYTFEIRCNPKDIQDFCKRYRKMMYPDLEEIRVTFDVKFTFDVK